MFGTSRHLFSALVGIACATSLTSCAREPEPAPPVSAPASAPQTLAQPDATNELPFGALDWPHEGATVPPSSGLLVAGWALDDSGIKEVRVFFDNRFKIAAPLEVERPDLQPYGNYTHGTNVHGFRIEIVTPAEPGNHTILVQAVDDRGATRDLGTAKVSVR